VPSFGYVSSREDLYASVIDPFTSLKRRILVLEDTVPLNFSVKKHLGEICSKRIFLEKVCTTYHQFDYKSLRQPVNGIFYFPLLQFLRRCWQTSRIY